VFFQNQKRKKEKEKEKEKELHIGRVGEHIYLEGR
jgi:hypothetical protein